MKFSNTWQTEYVKIRSDKIITMIRSNFKNKWSSRFRSPKNLADAFATKEAINSAETKLLNHLLML